MNMGKRFAIVFGLIFGYFLIPMPLLFLLAFLSDGNDTATLLIVGIAIALAIGFLPFMLWVVKRVFYFKTDQPTVTEDKLQKNILALNDQDMPLIVEQRNQHHLVVTLRYVDARWWEIFAQAGLSEMYQLHLKFNPEHHRVRMIDVQKKVNWRTGPTKVKLSASFFRGIILTKERGLQWGLKDNFKFGKHYDYAFDSEAIKAPFMHTILAHGWDVQFAIF